MRNGELVIATITAVIAGLLILWALAAMHYRIEVNSYCGDLAANKAALCELGIQAGKSGQQARSEALYLI